MKNGLIIFVIIAIIVISIISVLFLTKNNVSEEVILDSNTETSRIVYNYDDDNNTEVPNIKYPKEDDAVLNTNHVSKLVSGSIEPGTDKTINGKIYKDINSAEEIDYSIDNSLILADFEGTNDPYVVISDSQFVNDYEESDKLFKKDKEILPKRIYLLDDSITPLYKYYGITYYIPVVKVATPEEERIEYRDYNIVIMRNSENMSFYGKSDISASVKTDESSKLFDCYYILNENDEFTYKVYETDLDNDISTREIYLTLFNKIEDKIVLTKVLLRGFESGKIEKYVVPANILGNIKNYKNVFFCLDNDLMLSLSKISKDYIPFSYYIFNNGFEKVTRLANSSDYKSLENVEIELNNDYNYVDYSADGKYNVQREKEDKISYNLSLNNSVSSKLPEGTKLKIRQIIGNKGNAILENEAGELILICND